jgi:hypothetical protein
MTEMREFHGNCGKLGRSADGVVGCSNLVANKILKNGMFSNNTAKHFSQRANKYNHAILR